MRRLISEERVLRGMVLAWLLTIIRIVADGCAESNLVSGLWPSEPFDVIVELGKISVVLTCST
jgi:hypothetical protein